MDGSCLNHICPYSLHQYFLWFQATNRHYHEPNIFEFFLFNSCSSPPFASFTDDSLILCLLECLTIIHSGLIQATDLPWHFPDLPEPLFKSTGERLVTALVVKRQLLLDIRCRCSAYIRIRRHLEMAKQPSACKKVPGLMSVPALPVLNNICTVYIVIEVQVVRDLHYTRYLFQRT